MLLGFSLDSRIAQSAAKMLPKPFLHVTILLSDNHAAGKERACGNLAPCRSLRNKAMLLENSLHSGLNYSSDSPFRNCRRLYQCSQKVCSLRDKCKHPFYL